MANRIAEIRKMRGISQRQLAERLGTHLVSVSRMERGITSMSVERLGEVAKALSVRPSDLLDEKAGTPSSNDGVGAPRPILMYAGLKWVLADEHNASRPMVEIDLGDGQIVTREASDEDMLDARQPHERLREARGKSGFRTARDASNYIGISYGVYAAHENGTRPLKASIAARYAEIFRVSAAWIMFGESGGH